MENSLFLERLAVYLKVELDYLPQEDEVVSVFPLQDLGFRNVLSSVKPLELGSVLPND